MAKIYQLLKQLCKYSIISNYQPTKYFMIWITWKILPAVMVTLQKIWDKHFRLLNQDGNIAKKGVINHPTISGYGLHGKKML